jgi:hypothetical protein
MGYSALGSQGPPIVVCDFQSPPLGCDNPNMEITSGDSCLPKPPVATEDTNLQEAGLVLAMSSFSFGYWNKYGSQNWTAGWQM